MFPRELFLKEWPESSNFTQQNEDFSYHLWPFPMNDTSNGNSKIEGKNIFKKSDRNSRVLSNQDNVLKVFCI
jgi:hypothetical protein